MEKCNVCCFLTCNDKYEIVFFSVYIFTSNFVENAIKKILFKDNSRGFICLLFFVYNSRNFLKSISFSLNLYCVFLFLLLGLFGFFLNMRRIYKQNQNISAYFAYTIFLLLSLICLNLSKYVNGNKNHVYVSTVQSFGL